MDKVTPQNWTTYLQHTMEDVVPAVFCCKGTFPNCDNYQQKRPIDDGSKSPPPPPPPGMYTLSEKLFFDVLRYKTVFMHVVACNLMLHVLMICIHELNIDSDHNFILD